MADDIIKENDELKQRLKEAKIYSVENEEYQIKLSDKIMALQLEIDKLESMFMLACSDVYDSGKRKVSYDFWLKEYLSELEKRIKE